MQGNWAWGTFRPEKPMNIFLNCPKATTGFYIIQILTFSMAVTWWSYLISDGPYQIQSRWVEQRGHQLDVTVTSISWLSHIYARSAQTSMHVLGRVEEATATQLWWWLIYKENKNSPCPSFSRHHLSGKRWEAPYTVRRPHQNRWVWSFIV